MAGHRRGPLPVTPGPHLSDDAQDPLDSLRGVEAARIGAHSLQHAPHEVQVVDGLRPQGTAKLQTRGGGGGGGAKGQVSREPEPQRPPGFPGPASPGVAAHSAHTQG